MSRKQSGFVLLTTILMIAILSLLVLSLMQGVFLYIKGCNQIVTNHESFYRLEAVADKLVLSHPACSHGCTLVEGKHEYRYELEDLGVFPCLPIKVNNVVYSSRHWRITVAAIQPNPVILQLRIATIAGVAQCDGALPHTIRPGVLSWRKLTRGSRSNSVFASRSQGLGLFFSLNSSHENVNDHL